MNKNRKSFAEEKNNKTVEVVYILDRSGSMSGLEEDTIGGFNSMLKKQKEENSDIIWTTILFDDRVERIHDRMPVAQVRDLTSHEYYVRGCTALLDAVGGAITDIARVHHNMKKEYVPDKTLFVITTDGFENSSVEYTYNRVKKMIRHEQDKYGWEFIFMGANIDAAKEAGRIGIMPSHAATFVHDGAGMYGNFEAEACIMSKLSRGDTMDGSELDEVRRDYESRK